MSTTATGPMCLACMCPPFQVWSAHQAVNGMLCMWGEADSFARRIPGHEKWPAAVQMGATHVHPRHVKKGTSLPMVRGSMGICGPHGPAPSASGQRQGPDESLLPPAPCGSVRPEPGAVGGPSPRDRMRVAAGRRLALTPRAGSVSMWPQATARSMSRRKAPRGWFSPPGAAGCGDQTGP